MINSSDLSASCSVLVILNTWGRMKRLVLSLVLVGCLASKLAVEVPALLLVLSPFLAPYI